MLQDLRVFDVREDEVKEWIEWVQEGGKTSARLSQMSSSKLNQILSTEEGILKLMIHKFISYFHRKSKVDWFLLKFKTSS